MDAPRPKRHKKDKKAEPVQSMPVIELSFSLRDQEPDALSRPLQPGGSPLGPQAALPGVRSVQ